MGLHQTHWPVFALLESRAQGLDALASLDESVWIGCHATQIAATPRRQV